MEEKWEKYGRKMGKIWKKMQILEGKFVKKDQK